MTRISAIFTSLVFLTMLSFGQGSSAQPAAGNQMGQQNQSSGMKDMQGMHGMDNMSDMHGQMMKGMQADLDAMRSNLQKMKDQIDKVSDQSSKEQLQLNIQMWQSFMDDMDKHMAMMKQMMGAHKPASGTTHKHDDASATPK